MAKNKVKCDYCNAELLRYPTKTEKYFCDINCKSKWQVLQREKQGFTKEWLINQYFDLNKDLPLIGKEIGKDAKTIWNWANGYGLELNKRGHNYRKNLVMDGSTFLGKKHKPETKEKIRQARIKDGHVPYLRNGEHWLKSVPTKKHPNYKGGLSPERQSFYSSIEWVNVVKEVWKRDNAYCQKCGKHHNSEKNRGNFHIHHIVSFQVRELRCELSNLILLCKECHWWVHSKKNTKKQFIKE